LRQEDSVFDATAGLGGYKWPSAFSPSSTITQTNTLHCKINRYQINLQFGITSDHLPTPAMTPAGPLLVFSTHLGKGSFNAPDTVNGLTTMYKTIGTAGLMGLRSERHHTF